MKKLSEKEHIYFSDTFFEVFKSLVHLIFYRVHGYVHPDGCFLILHSVAFSKQEHFPTFFRQWVYCSPYSGLVVRTFLAFLFGNNAFKVGRLYIAVYQWVFLYDIYTAVSYHRIQIWFNLRNLHSWVFPFPKFCKTFIFIVIKLLFLWYILWKTIKLCFTTMRKVVF